jgi:hypothetical protein
VFVVATASGGLIPFLGGPLTTPDGRPAIPALAQADVRKAQERIEELFPFPDVFGAFAHAPGDQGLWESVREPGLLRVEPENELGILGFPTVVLIAARAPKRYVISWLERAGQHVELGDDGPRRCRSHPGRDAPTDVRSSQEGL